MDGFWDWIIAALVLPIAAAIALWMAGALYFDLSRKARWGRVLAWVWVVGVIALFVVWQPVWQPFAVLLGIWALFVAWWLRLKPRNDREWDPSVAVLARGVRAGDAITIENVRNLEYRTLTDFTPRYETRTIHLANLQALDIVFFHWGARCMSHPVLIFDFGPEGRICISIEVRYRKGQIYSLVRSLYRQQELIFTVSDERDAILRRTKHGNQTAYLYRFNATAEERRTAFLDYLGAFNSLCEKPRWYHGLFANCTTTYYRFPNSRLRLDWRVIINGRLDQALYEDGRLDHTLPFPELQKSALLNEVANSAPEEGFGDHIRRELERRRHER
jgi:hypothetical protein